MHRSLNYLAEIHGGNFEIYNCFEGIEAKTINITGGTIVIVSTDDGINAVDSELGENDTTRSSKVTFSGGTTTVIAKGDGIDSNGSIDITGGNVYVESTDFRFQTALDHDKPMNITGGTLIAVSKTIGEDDTGPKVSTIPMVINYDKGEGRITIDSIEYMPQYGEYDAIMIASTKLTPGDTKLRYGNKSLDVTLTNGVTVYGVPNKK